MTASKTTKRQSAANFPDRVGIDADRRKAIAALVGDALLDATPAELRAVCERELADHAPADAPPAAFLWLLAAATCLDRAAASSLAANPLSPNDWRAVRPFDFFERRLRNIRRRKGADK